MIDGAALKRLREERKLSQYDLAALANISRPQIGRFETGERGTDPGYYLVIRLAKALGVDPSAFMAPEPEADSVRVYPGGRPSVAQAVAV